MVLHTAEEVHQVAVDVVVDLQLVCFLLLGEKHPSRAAEYLYIAPYLIGGEPL